jgi:hypothetical protein
MEAEFSGGSMKNRLFAVAMALALGAGPALMHAQYNFNLHGRQVQVHSFGSQGFAYSNDNSYLTMNTSKGSVNFDDLGVNVSSQITDKFRVGAQVYTRRLGELNKGQVTLDWAVVDYRFKPWFGARGGKVKTVLGLYNNLQDVDSLFTWALLPQSMYPIDLRGSTIAHIGGDLYGKVKLGKYGKADYTAYGGVLPSDPHQGYMYALRSIFPFNTPYVGPIAGGDLKWTTPLKGFLAGASYMEQHPKGSGIQPAGVMGGPGGPFTQDTKKRQISQFYVQYLVKGLHVDGEYHRDYRDEAITMPGSPVMDIQWNARSWYISGAYRFSKRIEVGSYYSFFTPDQNVDTSLPGNHIYDKVVTARFDLKSYWTVKVEGHFIDGYGQIDSARGFYDNFPSGMSGTAGFKPQTNMLLVRTGFSF